MTKPGSRILELDCYLQHILLATDMEVVMYYVMYGSEWPEPEQGDSVCWCGTCRRLAQFQEVKRRLKKVRKNIATL